MIRSLAPGAPGLAVGALGLAVLAVPLAAQRAWSPADPAADPIRIEEEERLYVVTGSTDQEIWDSLVEGARREGNELVFAWTTVSTEYSSRMVREEDLCRVVGAEVLVRITVTLPEWAPPRDASMALRRQWNRYELAIRRHEQGHVGLARGTARRLRDALIGLTAPDCEELKERGTEVGGEILAEGKAEQDRYDDETGHGRTQGVEWVIDRRGA